MIYAICLHTRVVDPSIRILDAGERGVYLLLLQKKNVMYVTKQMYLIFQYPDPRNTGTTHYHAGPRIVSGYI